MQPLLKKSIFLITTQLNQLSIRKFYWYWFNLTKICSAHRNGFFHSL